VSNDTPQRALLAVSVVEIGSIGEWYITFMHTDRQPLSKQFDR